MKWLKVRYRIVNFWLCRKRGHDVSADMPVITFRGPDKLNPDGTIDLGDDIGWYTIRCFTCKPL